MSKRVTIRDLAEYANVSPGTVDRVIHQRGKVSNSKRKKIEEAIAHFNYNPNLAARSLAGGRKISICTLLPETNSLRAYWSLPEKGIRQFENSHRDFGIDIECFEYSLFDEDSFIKQSRAILDRKPGGVVLAPLFEKESIYFIGLLDEMKIPYAFIDADIPGQNNLTYIGPNLERSGSIGAKLINNLVELEDKILIVNMTKGIENSANVGDIEKGFRKYFDMNQQTNRQVFTLNIPSTDEAVIIRELIKFYSEHPGIKAVFVTNSMASIISKFHKYHDLNIKLVGFDLIPENIEELKSDNIEYLISQSPVSQGRRAVQSLFDFYMYKKKPAKIQNMPLDIIIKENVDYYINADN